MGKTGSTNGRMLYTGMQSVIINFNSHTLVNTSTSMKTTVNTQVQKFLQSTPNM